MHYAHYAGTRLVGPNDKGGNAFRFPFPSTTCTNLLTHSPMTLIQNNTRTRSNYSGSLISKKSNKPYRAGAFEDGEGNKIESLQTQRQWQKKGRAKVRENNKIIIIIHKKRSSKVNAAHPTNRLTSIDFKQMAYDDGHRLKSNDMRSGKTRGFTCYYVGTSTGASI